MAAAVHIHQQQQVSSQLSLHNQNNIASQTSADQNVPQNVNQSFQQAASNGQLASQPLYTKRHGTSSGNNLQQLSSQVDSSQQKVRQFDVESHQLRSVQMAVDIYKSALPKPKGQQQNIQASSNTTNQILSNKLKQRKQQESMKLKLAGQAQLQRDQNCNSELGQLQPINLQLGNPSSSTVSGATQNPSGHLINQALIQRNVIQNHSPTNNRPNHSLNNRQQQQTLLTSSRNTNSQTGANQQQPPPQVSSFAQRLARDLSRNRLEKRQSISFDKPNQQSKFNNNNNACDSSSIFQQQQQKNPYLASAKAALKNHKGSLQKMKDKAYSILTANQQQSGNNLRQKALQMLGWEPKSNKNSSSKASPRYQNNNNNKMSFNQAADSVTAANGGEKLPNLKTQGDKSLERNNSVFSRKDLIKKEYNKIIETKLPNILNLMNQEKYNISTGADTSINENCLDYDDTDLLSKMFSKDQNRSGLLSIQDQNSLQNKQQHGIDKTRYQLKPNIKSNIQQYQQQYQQQLGSSQSQDRIYGSNEKESQQHQQELISKRKQSIESKRQATLRSNGPPTMISDPENNNNNSGTILMKDEELIKLDRLQLINASARYELLSANQQLLDFHINRIMQRKHHKKNFMHATTGKKNQQRKQGQQHMVVCEDLENESDLDGEDNDLTLSYDDVKEKSKMDRLKQLQAPHIIMQDRLNSMNPLTFGDTIRLPVLNLTEQV